MSTFNFDNTSFIYILYGILGSVFSLGLLGLFIWGYFKTKNPGYIILSIWGVLTLITRIVNAILLKILIGSLETLTVYNTISFLVYGIISLILIFGVLFTILRSDVVPETT